MIKLLTRALCALALLCALSSSALAIDVTIAGASFPAYNYSGGTAKLRVYASQTFTASDGQIVPGGTQPGSTTGMFTTVNCTVASNTLTCPSVMLKSTTDALEGADATYTAVLFDAAGTRRDFFPVSDFWLTHTAGANTTWAVIRSYMNSSPRPPANTGYPTNEQMLAAIAANNTVGGPATVQDLGRVRIYPAPDSPESPIAAGVNLYASAANFGLSALDTAPAVPTQPIAVGTNSPLLGNATKLQSRTIASTAPTNGQALVYNTGSSQWQPGTVTTDAPDGIYAANAAYGIVVGAGQAQGVRIANRVGLQAAVNAAIAAAKPLILPAGTIEVELEPTPSSKQYLAIAGSITIQGRGRDKSTVRIYPDPPTFLYNGIRITGGTDFDFRDFALAGPTNPCAGSTTGTGCLPVGSSSDTFLYTVGISYNNETGGARLLMDNVKITGQFAQAIEVAGSVSSAASLKADFDRLDLSAYDGLLNFYDGADAGRWLRVVRSYFHGQMHLNTGGLANHQIYAHRNTTLDIGAPGLGNLFSETHYYGVQTQGGPSTAPDHINIIGNTFTSTDGGNGRGFINQSNVRALFLGNTCRIGACINVKTAADIVANDFGPLPDGTTATTAITYTNVTAAPENSVNISGPNRFNKSSIEMGGSKAWRMTGGELRGGSVITTNDVTEATIDGTRVIVESPATYAIGPNQVNTGNIVLRNLHVTGATANGAVFGRVAPGTTISLESNKFLNTVVGLSVSGSNSGTWVGSNNYFAAIPGQPSSTPYQGVEVRRGVNPSAVASANDLVLSVNYDTFNISGTTQLNSLWWGNSDVTQGTAKFFSGTARLIFAGAVLIKHGTGNIKTNTGADVTTVAGRVYAFTFDPQANVWYMQ